MRIVLCTRSHAINYLPNSHSSLETISTLYKFPIFKFHSSIVGYIPLEALTADDCKILLTNSDININENFKMNGKKLLHCKTIKDIRELNDMTRAEAEALLKDINQFKLDGVPKNLIVPKGTVEQFVLCNARY